MASTGTWTQNTLITNQMHYQLCYRGICYGSQRSLLLRGCTWSLHHPLFTFNPWPDIVQVCDLGYIPLDYEWYEIWSPISKPEVNFYLDILDIAFEQVLLIKFLTIDKVAAGKGNRTLISWLEARHNKPLYYTHMWAREVPVFSHSNCLTVITISHWSFHNIFQKLFSEWII